MKNLLKEVIYQIKKLKSSLINLYRNLNWKKKLCSKYKAEKVSPEITSVYPPMTLTEANKRLWGLSNTLSISSIKKVKDSVVVNLSNSDISIDTFLCTEGGRIYYMTSCISSSNNKDTSIHLTSFTPPKIEFTFKKSLSICGNIFKFTIKTFYIFTEEDYRKILNCGNINSN